MAGIFRQRQPLASITVTVTDAFNVTAAWACRPEWTELVCLYFVDILLAALPHKDAAAARRDLKEFAGALYDAVKDWSAASAIHDASQWRALLRARRTTLDAAHREGPVDSRSKFRVKFRIRAALHVQQDTPYMDIHFHPHTDPNYTAKIRMALDYTVLDYLDTLAPAHARDTVMTVLMLFDYYSRYAPPSRETLGHAPAYARISLPASLLDTSA